ncbi:hypothetical protein Enr13x_76210 [Stieleria neptunia]|uniref:Uncharacterized protein n=1 Tax=Stieleria neptunia TaxID=2527979 RepID=A0A518I3N0_9BACT|nr:hypothetical protein [Stieleria neptunia]QDV47710.1 hypothetical protein Enr13x_76210 [Stieleria neptunia]
MSFFKIEQYAQSAEGIVFDYSNAPFSLLFIGGLLVLYVVMAVHRTRRGQWSRDQWEKIAIEFGVPTVCVAIVVAMSYERQTLVGRFDAADVVRSDRSVFHFLAPEVSRMPVADVRAIRIDSVDWQNTRNGSPDGPVRTTYFIRLDVAGEREVLLVGCSRDRKHTEAVADQLVRFLRAHPDHQPRGFYVRL